MKVSWHAQVLQAEGLQRYLDPKCLQQEIQEANDMTSEELDRAARALIRQSQHETQHPSYYEHLGGLSTQELQDYNQYSPSSMAASQGLPYSRHTHQTSHQQPQLPAQNQPSETYDSGDEEDLVHVTTTL